MKKVGYISCHASEQDIEKLSELTPNLMFSKKTEIEDTVTEEKSFLAFLKENKNNTIVLLNLASIGRSVGLIQLRESFSYIQSHNISIEFVDKGAANALSDEAYVNLIQEFIHKESTSKSIQTSLGLKKARLAGRVNGRPSISKEKIKHIQKMYYKDKKTYREIAQIMDVSLGTIYKYVNQIKPEFTAKD